MFFLTLVLVGCTNEYDIDEPVAVHEIEGFVTTWPEPDEDPTTMEHDSSVEICDGLDNDGDGYTDQDDPDDDTWCNVGIGCFYLSSGTTLSVMVMGPVGERLVADVGDMDVISLTWDAGTLNGGWNGSPDAIVALFVDMNTVDDFFVEGEGANGRARVDVAAMYVMETYYGFTNRCEFDWTSSYPIIPP